MDKVKPGIRDMKDDYQEVTKLMGGWCNGKKALKLTNHTVLNLGSKEILDPNNKRNIH